MTTVNVNIITKSSSSKKPKKKRTKKRSKRQPPQQRVTYPAAVQTGTYAYNTPIHLDPPFVEQSRLALNTLSSRIQEMKPDYDRIGKIEESANRALADSNTINDTVTYMANNFSRLVSQEVKENMPTRPRPFDNLFDKSGLPKQLPKRLFLRTRDTTDTDTDVEPLPNVIVPPPPPLVRETSTGSVKEIVKMMDKAIEEYERVKNATEKLENVQQPKKVPSLEDIKNIKSESEKSTGRGAAEKSSSSSSSESSSSSDDSRSSSRMRAEMGSTDYEDYKTYRQERIKEKEAKVKPPVEVKPTVEVKPPVKEPSMKEVVDELAKKRELIKELPAPSQPPPSRPPPPKPPITETPPKATTTLRHPSGRKVRSDKGMPRGAYKKKDA